MLDTFLSGPYAPFTVSLTLLFGLLVLEIVFLLIGGSLMGDGPEAEVDIPGFDAPEVDVDLDGFDVDAAEFEIDTPDEALVAAGSGGGQSPLGWLGLGRMPTLIWLASLFMSFGVSGVALQSVATGIFGGPLTAAIAAVPCGIAALWFTGRFGALFARLLPRTETQSVSSRQLARRRGLVTQGTARRGNPAEVRVSDRYGNIHHLRAEPMEDGVEIAQGTEVLVLRHRPSGEFRLIAL